MLYADSARRRSVCRGFVLNLLALSACALITQSAAPRPVRAPVAPDSVDGWAVTPKRSTWQGRELMCLVVSDDPSVDNLHSVAHPDHPRYRAFEELEDPHGALGVWPSAYAACAALERIASERKRPPTVLELGCGAGLPSYIRRSSSSRRTSSRPTSRPCRSRSSRRPGAATRRHHERRPSRRPSWTSPTRPLMI